MTVTHLTSKELADRWACSMGWLANMRSAGEGPPYLKVGAKVLYPVHVVEQYEAERLVAA